MTRRTPSILVAAALMGVATLAPASLTSAHPAPSAERSREVGPGAAGTEPHVAAPLTTAVPASLRQVKAHARSPGVRAQRWAGAMPAELAGLLPGLVAALAALAVAPWRRRIAASLTVLALVALAFEAGVHSVHHLWDEGRAAHCSVASTSTHLSGTAADGPFIGLPVVVGPATPSFQAPPADGPSLGSAAGRGPPAPLNV